MLHAEADKPNRERYTMKKRNRMLKVILSSALVIMATGFFAAGFAQQAAAPQASLAIAAAAAKPLVVYYSRLGHARMLATALKNQLNGDIEEIVSEKDRGVPTIMWEQLFGLDDAQKPCAKNIQEYNPIIVVAPIYFMKLSAPARTFIENSIPKGKDVYVVTTSGGPLAGFSGKSIKALVEKSGLNAKGVHGFQIGKKTQSDFDNETRVFLLKTSVK